MFFFLFRKAWAIKHRVRLGHPHPYTYSTTPHALLFFSHLDKQGHTLTKKKKRGMMMRERSGRLVLVKKEG